MDNMGIQCFENDSNLYRSQQSLHSLMSRSLIDYYIRNTGLSGGGLSASKDIFII